MSKMILSECDYSCHLYRMWYSRHSNHTACISHLHTNLALPSDLVRLITCTVYRHVKKVSFKESSLFS